MKKITLMLLLFLLLQTILFSDEYMTVSVDNTEIAVPLGWMAQYTKSPYLFILYAPIEENDTFQENCNLVIELLPTKYSVENYIHASVATLKSIYKEFKIIEAEKNYHIYTGYLNDIFIKQMQFFYIKDKTAYILTFSSTPDNFDRYIEIFNLIADTFKFE